MSKKAEEFFIIEYESTDTPVTFENSYSKGEVFVYGATSKEAALKDHLSDCHDKDESWSEKDKYFVVVPVSERSFFHAQKKAAFDVKLVGKK